MKIVKLILVVATAVFMAFHTQIFVSRIEPNVIFSWTASLLIEGFIIVLALSKRTPIRYLLLILLFTISVVSASASFVAKNEKLLDQFFVQRRVISQLQNDLNQTQKAYQFGQKYTTKTLQRERQLQDELRQILTRQNGDLTLANALIFFCFVLVIQATSVYVATTLKHDMKQSRETVNRDSDTAGDTVSETDSETPSDTPIETVSDTELIQPYEIDIKGIVKRLRAEGKSYREIAKETRLSLSRVQRLLSQKKSV
jgi:hypothetical protein